MLHLLDESLEAFLRAEVPLSKRQIDISFEAPDDEWGAQVAKPTVNLFLWDVRNNVDERESGMRFEEAGGKTFRAPPRPRVDCRYLVTAWTSQVKDEHQLLGSLLTALLTNHEIAPEYLQGDFAKVRPIPTLRAALPKAEDNSDFWTALGGQIKPGLDVIVTATVDLQPVTEVGPPVERYELELRQAPARAATGRSVETVGTETRRKIRSRSGDRAVVEAAPDEDGG